MIVESQMTLLDRARGRWDAVMRAGTKRILKTSGKVRRANAYYWLDPERVLTRRYAESFSGLQAHHRLYGNYWLDDRIPLGPHSVVYSLGVGRDIAFDRAIAEAHGCRVCLYDPTPSSIRFMQSLMAKAPEDPTLSLLDFHAIGAWKSDTVLAFTIPGRGGSASAILPGGAMSTTFEARCETVTTMMRKNGHSHIDVLKMDIEGAAALVMDHLVEARLFPTQLVVELERPRGDVKKLIGWFAHVERLCEVFRAEGYQITLLPRKKGRRYFSLELLFARCAGGDSRVP